MWNPNSQQNSYRAIENFISNKRGNMKKNFSLWMDRLSSPKAELFSFPAIQNKSKGVARQIFFFSLSLQKIHVSLLWAF